MGALGRGHLHDLAHRAVQQGRAERCARGDPGVIHARLELSDDREAFLRRLALAAHGDRITQLDDRGVVRLPLERLGGRATSVERTAAFVDSVGAAKATRGPSAGLGEDVRLRGHGLVGSGLELDGELVQLSAFTSDDGGERAFGRIARPSRRRAD